MYYMKKKHVRSIIAYKSIEKNRNGKIKNYICTLYYIILVWKNLSIVSWTSFEVAHDANAYFSKRMRFLKMCKGFFYALLNEIDLYKVCKMKSGEVWMTLINDKNWYFKVAHYFSTFQLSKKSSLLKGIKLAVMYVWVGSELIRMRKSFAIYSGLYECDHSYILTTYVRILHINFYLHVLHFQKTGRFPC